MKLTISLILFFTAALAQATNEPGVAMMSCSGVSEAGNSETSNSFRIVMEQTNSDEVDGSVLLNESIYNQSGSDFSPLQFRIRIFKNVEPHLITNAENNQRLTEHLMGPDIPSNAYTEISEGTKAFIAFGSLKVKWNWNESIGVHDTNVNYRPSNKSEEFYEDNITGDFRSVYCEPPFLKSQQQVAPTTDPEILSALGVDNAEVEMN